MNNENIIILNNLINKLDTSSNRDERKKIKDDIKIIIKKIINDDFK